MFLDRPGCGVVYGSASGTAEDGKSLMVKQREGGETKELPFTHLVIAAGPWTGALSRQLFPASTSLKKSKLDLAVSGSRAHSIVLKTERELTAHALFTDMTLEDGDMAEPEVYARPDGTVYM